jgi:hypothetical protein
LSFYRIVTWSSSFSKLRMNVHWTGMMVEVVDVVVAVVADVEDPGQ